MIQSAFDYIKLYLSHCMNEIHSYMATKTGRTINWNNFDGKSEQTIEYDARDRIILKGWSDHNICGNLRIMGSFIKLNMYSYYNLGNLRVERNYDREILETKIYYPHGSPRCETWQKIKYDGGCHRDNAPAIINYYDTGQISSESWRQDQLRHRIDGPAVIKYYRSGQIKSQSWWYHGQRHRDNGPATIAYLPDGNLQYKSYWVKNDRLYVERPIRYRPSRYIFSHH